MTTEDNFQSWFTRKCFLLHDQLIIDILKMATKKTLDELTEDDAKKMSIVKRVGVENTETVIFDGKEIGKITTEFPEQKILCTFTPNTPINKNNLK